jgi:hypothetical protein
MADAPRNQDEPEAVTTARWLLERGEMQGWEQHLAIAVVALYEQNERMRTGLAEVLDGLFDRTLNPARIDELYKLVGR